MFWKSQNEFRHSPHTHTHTHSNQIPQFISSAAVDCLLVRLTERQRSANSLKGKKKSSFNENDIWCANKFCVFGGGKCLFHKSIHSFIYNLLLSCVRVCDACIRFSDDYDDWQWWCEMMHGVSLVCLVGRVWVTSTTEMHWIFGIENSMASHTHTLHFTPCIFSLCGAILSSFASGRIRSLHQFNSISFLIHFCTES